MKIYLIRHAESVGNTKGSLVSTTDFPLTEKGWLQARRAGDALCPALKGTRIAAYCSPLLRAKQTLEEISRRIGQETLVPTFTSDLREMDLGILEGMSFDEQAVRYPEIDLARRLSFLHAPEGECYGDIKQRLRRFLDRYAQRFSEVENVLVVSHGITLRVLTNLLLDRPDEDVNLLNWMENTAMTVLDHPAGSDTFLVERLNDHGHLQELKTENYPKWGLFAEEGAYLSSWERAGAELGV